MTNVNIEALTLIYKDELIDGLESKFYVLYVILN